MSTSPGGTAVRCERCGAAQLLSHEGHARCLFCLHQQPLPDAVREPLLEQRVLGEQLEALVRDTARAARRGRAAWVLAGLLVPLLALTVMQLAGATMSRTGDPLGFAMSAFIGGGGVLPFVVVPALWLRITGAVRARVLAALPHARPTVDDVNVSSACPTCGAPHDARPEALTATCGHCRTEALLPAPVVTIRLARLHEAVVAAKARGDVAVDAQKAAVEAWQKQAVPLILASVCFYGVVVVAFVVLVQATRP